MAIVSISEAARLTGKTRATIHHHINTGKLSKTRNDTDELNSLKTRLAILEAENYHLKDHVDSLKQAMLLLEHQKVEKNKSWLARLFGKND